MRRSRSSRRTPGARAGVLVVTAALLLPVPALAKAGAVLGCGSVITSDTTLTADVTGCVGTGLVIGADGVTLDLAGHRVTGDAVEDPNDMGISVTGHHDVRITDGVVEGFYRGIVLESSPRARVTSMTVRESTRRGIVFSDGSDGGRATHDETSDNGASGIAVVLSDGATVEHDVSLRNIGGAGVRLEGATRATVAHNRLDGDTLGVQIVDGADANRVVHNHLADSEELAVEQNFSDGNLLAHNVIVHGSGISLESSDDTTITHNRIHDLTGPDGIGIQVYGNRDLVTWNGVVDALRYGIEVDDFQDEGHSPATGNVIRHNRVRGGTLGIAIGPEAAGVVLDTVVDRNRVQGAADDGIQLLGPSTGLQTSVVSRNVSDRNGDLGIAAVPGTVDGGGNVASGNGNPLQCLNIACR